MLFEEIFLCFDPNKRKDMFDQFLRKSHGEYWYIKPTG